MKIHENSNTKPHLKDSSVINSCCMHHLHRRVHRTTAEPAEPVLVVGIPLERLIARRARESSAVSKSRSVRGRGSGGVDVVAHFVCFLCGGGFCMFVVLVLVRVAVLDEK